MGRSAYYSITCASAQSSAAKVWLCPALTHLFIPRRWPGCGQRNLRAFEGTSRSHHSHSRETSGFSTTPLRPQLPSGEKRKLFRRSCGIKGQCETWASVPYLSPGNIKPFAMPTARIYRHMSATAVMRWFAATLASCNEVRLRGSSYEDCIHRHRHRQDQLSPGRTRRTRQHGHPEEVFAQGTCGLQR